MMFFQSDLSYTSCSWFRLSRLRGKYAFDSPELGGSALKTVQGDYNLFDSVWADISDEAKDLVQMLLTVDPNKRITLS